MTDLRAAAQQALEALECINKYGFVLADYEGPMEQAITTLRAALEQPEQEPVAWFNGKPVYSAPPRREWRWLTEEEMVALAHRTCWEYRHSSDAHHSHTYKFNHHTLMDFRYAIEAALKERNA